ncbi:MAG: DNA polymerase/3'-5' exonuclease PolX [Deferribacteres bacterium]|nr:DNA polymerase/3'-5' exonuclease PolX [candidate division KSB1 bacterium]MCB9504476.1 DNA polymerase/3'-5' exonuclease PolX [Deferribacteres bacterium]
MEKKDVIAVLEHIAILLELKGENPFKSRAYTNGARILKAREESIGELVDTGKLGEIKGIGKALADKITTLITNGSLPYYENLKAEFPATLFGLLRIPGMGSKKIKILYDQMGIASLIDLETACRENRIAGLTGFGEKTQEKILQGIDFIKQHEGQHLYFSALAVAGKMITALKQHPKIIRVEMAGSLRRAKEVVKDVDIVASVDDSSRQEVMDFFVSQGDVESIVAHGITKSSIIVSNGLQVDLRLVSNTVFPFALHHFTGSKEHNTAMRREAKKHGYKMNEYGLFTEADRSLVCQDEKEIFAALGMGYIPPELREDRGEIEAALENTLPVLIEKNDLCGILHNHTTWSDGSNSLEEMANACRAMGMSYLGIADHSQAAQYANGLTPARLQQQAQAIAELNKNFTDFRIFHGTECDILSDGSLDFPDEVLAQLDYVVVSVHSKLEMSETEATERIIKAMQNPFVKILAHPTGRILLGRKGYPLNYKEIFAAAVENNVVIEINANPYRYDLDWRYIRQAKEAGVLLSINPDAHKISGLADMLSAVGIARKGWLTKDDVLNTKSLDEITAFFAAKNGK